MKCCQETKRGKAGTGVSESKVVTVGRKCQRGRVGTRETPPPGDKDGTNWNVVHKRMKYLEDRSRAFLPYDLLYGFGKAKGLLGIKGMGGINTSNNEKRSETQIWPSMALAKNYFAYSHIDPDFFISLNTCLLDSNDEEHKDKVVSYFCFPAHGIAVAMRDGDLLLFNSLVYHCCGSKVMWASELDVHQYAYYIKANDAGGNDNSHVLTQDELNYFKTNL